MAGWIRLSRNIFECWLWDEKPFSKAQAWIDLLLMANYETKKIVLGNELIEVERGSFITSEVKLSERWGWSRTKTRSYLYLLESDNMIIKKSDSKKTVITIVKYGIYQDIETAEEQQKNSKKTAKKQQKNTTNNINNINNINKEESAEQPPIDYKAVVDDYNTICKSLPQVKSLSDARRKAIKARLKTRGMEDIHKAFQMAEGSDFLKGANKSNWTATFDWIMKDTNMAKILDGNYENKTSKEAQNKKVHNFVERDYSDDYFKDMESRFARN